MFDYPKRVRLLRGMLEKTRLDGFVTFFSPHLRYLTGYSGSNGLCIVTQSDVFFLTDFRYKEQIQQEVTCSRPVVTSGDLIEKAAAGNLLRGCKRVAVEKDYLPLGQFQELRSNFPKVRFVPTAEYVESFAAVKNDAEISLLRQAIRITDAVLAKVLKIIRPGISELDVSAEISYYHKKLGAEKDSFEPIVVSGSRASLPHGRPSSKKIKNGELVTLDLGCIYNGYCSDLTRTVAVGKAGAEERKVYDVVLKAQQLAIDSAKNGISGRELDGVARKYIRSRGYGKYFGHGLGHGIGLEIHEAPRVSARSLHTLRDGNVVTVEPGVYLPGRFGVRIEDDIVVRNGGCEVLTTAPKTLMIL